jgi:uncharacterized protein (DUF924 family)
MVLDFWFETLEPIQWWQKDDTLDQTITSRFGALHQQAGRGELAHWRDSDEGCLAEIIVLDQFSRNIYRNMPQAFAYDGMALILAQEAVRAATDQRLKSINQRAFIYMPYMHSESSIIHQQAAQLFRQAGMESQYEFECKHQAIIARFGRYPHRNAILGRKSTTEEIAFLSEEGSSF